VAVLREFRKTATTDHTLWIARKYKQTGREPYRLREHPVMKHRMDIDAHNDLHAHLNPLPVMSRGLAISALSFLPNVAHKGQFESFTAIIEHFAVVSQRMGQQAVESGRFAEHLEEQLRFM